VPRWNTETEEDKALEEYARKLMGLRNDIEAEMNRYLGA
jgi:hypothetical protein